MRKPYRGRAALGTRARTIAVKHLTKAVLGESWEPELDVDRPRTRGECREQERPCPFVGCKHHLYLDINPSSGSIKINFPDREPWELEHSCSLDVADMGGLTLEQVGVICNVTRERARQLEATGLMKLRFPLRVAGVDNPDAYFPHPEGYGHQETARAERDPESLARARAKWKAKRRAAGGDE